jgi:F0F1-type ATP synthase delta subunit
MEDKQLIIKWFESIETLAKEQTNSNGTKMDPLEVLNEIAVKAKDAKEYVNKFITNDHIKKAEDFLRMKFENSYYTVVYSGTLDDLIWEYKNWMER